MAQRAIFEPSCEEAAGAVWSLYGDEIKPFGRILMRRIRERLTPAGGDVEAAPLVDPACLRRVCEACPGVVVEPAEGREFVAYLLGQPRAFVDACSLVDPYPAKLWEEAAAYFAGISRVVGPLPCGRYACAAELARRGLPFLRGRSLGEVCHIVQLAVSARKLLGHAGGRIVAYCDSEESARARSAVRHQPVLSASQLEEALPHATWESLCWGLRVILRCSAKPEPGAVMLSNLKRLFRAELKLELSETALGHTRLIEMLSDARLRDVCLLECIGNGQAVVRTAEPGMWRRDLAGPAFTAVAPLAIGAQCWSTCASTRQPAPAPVPHELLVPSVHCGWALAQKSSRQSERGTAASPPASSATGFSETCSFSSCAGSSAGVQESLADPGDAEEWQGCLSPEFLRRGLMVRNTFIDEAPERQGGASRRCRSAPARGEGRAGLAA